MSTPHRHAQLAHGALLLVPGLVIVRETQRAVRRLERLSDLGLFRGRARAHGPRAGTPA